MISEISNQETGYKFPIIKKEEGRVENMLILTKEEYKIYGNKAEYTDLLLKIHRRILQVNNIQFDNEFFKFHISLYEKINKNTN